MTNSEKYLKDGVNRQFLTEFSKWYYSITREIKNVDTVLAEFLAEKSQPTLTEDEKVILRNLNEQIWEKIGRDKYGTLSLKTRTEDDENFFNGCYGHLFQFIKERRRI